MAARKTAKPGPYSGYGKKTKPLSKRRFEAASTSRLNSAAWAKATDAGINQDLQRDGETLRIRSTYEAANNPHVRGVIETHVIDVVGDEGPTLQIQVDDDGGEAARRWAEAAEWLWEWWWAAPEVNGQLSGAETLQLGLRMCWMAGEFLEQIVQMPEDAGPIQLRIHPIHPRRLNSQVSHPRPGTGDRLICGITVDAQGKPLTYHVSDSLDDATYGSGAAEIRPIPAKDIIHWFRVEEPGQLRGVPWLASALAAINDLRQFDVATLDAARTAADFACVLFSDHPDIEPIVVNETTPIKRRQISMMPPGWKPTQIQAQHPTTQYSQFRAERLREIGRPVGMPLMVVQLDSGNHNYSSARFDAQVYWRGNRALQAAFTRTKLDRLLRLLLNEAEMKAAAGKLTREAFRRWPGAPMPDLSVLANRAPAGWWPKWTWPTPPHVDPAKEAGADDTRLKQGTTTRADVCARNGLDVETVERQRDREERESQRLAVARLVALQAEIDAANEANPNLRLHWSHILAIGGAVSAPGAFLQGAAPPPSADEPTDEPADDENVDDAASRIGLNGFHR